MSGTRFTHPDRIDQGIIDRQRPIGRAASFPYDRQLRYGWPMGNNDQGGSYSRYPDPSPPIPHDEDEIPKLSEIFGIVSTEPEGTEDDSCGCGCPSCSGMKGSSIANLFDGFEEDR